MTRECVNAANPFSSHPAGVVGKRCERARLTHGLSESSAKRTSMVLTFPDVTEEAASLHNVLRGRRTTLRFSPNIVHGSPFVSLPASAALPKPDSSAAPFAVFDFRTGVVRFSHSETRDAYIGVSLYGSSLSPCFAPLIRDGNGVDSTLPLPRGRALRALALYHSYTHGGRGNASACCVPASGRFSAHPPRTKSSVFDEMRSAVRDAENRFSVKLDVSTGVLRVTRENTPGFWLETSLPYVCEALSAVLRFMTYILLTV